MKADKVSISIGPKKDGTRNEFTIVMEAQLNHTILERIEINYSDWEENTNTFTAQRAIELFFDQYVFNHV